VQAAMKLIDALEAADDSAAWDLCVAAREPLEKLEVEILRAEHPPFEGWYRKTWVRRETKDWNVHRPYEELRVFLATRGRENWWTPSHCTHEISLSFR